MKSRTRRIYVRVQGVAMVCMASLFMLASCVPNEKLSYFQHQGLTRKEVKELPRDTVFRSYTLADYEYRLKPEDVLSVKVSSLSESDIDFFANYEEARANIDPLLSGYMVDETGNIELPVLGKVHVNDMTVEEVQLRLQEMLTGYLKRPVVIVKHLNYTFTVLGEVKKPGRFVSYNKKITILDAIGLAGDMTDLADRSRVKLIRHQGRTAEIIYLNMLDDRLLATPYYFVRPNDVIYVEPLGVKNTRNYSLANFGVIMSTISILTVLYVQLF